MDHDSTRHTSGALVASPVCRHPMHAYPPRSTMLKIVVTPTPQSAQYLIVPASARCSEGHAEDQVVRLTVPVSLCLLTVKALRCAPLRPHERLERARQPAAALALPRAPPPARGTDAKESRTPRLLAARHFARATPATTATRAGPKRTAPSSARGVGAPSVQLVLEVDKTRST